MKQDRSQKLSFLEEDFDEVECPDCGTYFIAISIDDEHDLCVKCQNTNDGVFDV